ncbi:cytochrome c3 family protein [Desulfosoma caldarium]|uniref:Class III cytochrome C family protein n=1 Tax=Desulfosoma caldarium TaxID=610254 RepID=A0A3N1VF81_9BACT|nr:cytochrome c3 family protein [Desulfosoma caldarium]ROR01494.1 class III cytochrome C family protein [Desulfosoma caldarium]
MKRSVRILVVCCIAVFLGTWAWCQDEVMVLKGDDPKGLKRSPVSFPHERHAQLVECTLCHHDYDAYGANKGSEGQKCADCHGHSSVSNPVPLQRAFHEQCMSCHERLHAREGRNLPVMCGQCHKR